MAEAALKTAPAEETENLTDGFHLVIDALKLNGINTIYNVPGIPITDLGRMMQAEGMRVLSFRHEQNAGYAASIAGLREMFVTFENGELRAHLDEYSDVNIEFHQTIIRLSRNAVLLGLAANLFTHMRMIRRTTIGEQDRADRSIRDHMNIIEALEARETDRAEHLVRDHALGLAEHVRKYADYLD